MGVVAAVVVLALFGVLWLRNSREGEPEAVASFPGVDAFSPDYPANGPFPGPDANLSEDQARAVDAAAVFAFAGAQTTVVSVERSTYHQVMCGRMSVGAGPDFPVWLVWFKGPFRNVVTSQPASKLYVIDARTFQSLQTFAPWPIAPAAKANCPPE
jgi:hypothetical protein